METAAFYTEDTQDKALVGVVKLLGMFATEAEAINALDALRNQTDDAIAILNVGITWTSPACNVENT